MKALFVIDGLGSGGAQRQMVSLALALRERGHLVEFFVYSSEDHFRDLLERAEIPVILHKKRSRYSISPILALFRTLKGGRHDIVLSFLDTPSLYAELACLPLKAVRLIVSERSMYPSGKLPIGRLILQQMHRFADWITVNSQHQRIRMESRFHWMRPKIQTIYNGYDLGFFKPRPQPMEKGNSLNLLAIASVSYSKNSLNLARALHICRDKYKTVVNLTWAGSKYVSKHGEIPSQETDLFLSSVGVEAQWKWLGVRSDVHQLLLECDALIHPSFFEGLPNVICEALACGRPVLASRVCDHPLLIEEGYSGFLFDPTSPEDIAAAIFKFSQLSSDQRCVMATNARSFAEKNLSLVRYTLEYEHLMMRLINQHRDRH